MTNQNIANVVIAILNEIELDGEMMEYIINQVGMRDQMIKQLAPQNDIVELERGSGVVVASFTKNALIEYTRGIQERCKTAAIEAATNSGVDFDYYTGIELNDKELELTFDEGGIFSEIENAIDDAFGTDDDSVWEEATDVITFMSKG